MSTQRLIQIKEEIKELADEAIEIVKNTDNKGSKYQRARSYWYPHILGALDEDHEFLGGSMIKMQDTINELGTEVTEDYDLFSYVKDLKKEIDEGKIKDVLELDNYIEESLDELEIEDNMWDSAFAKFIDIYEEEYGYNPYEKFEDN